LGVLDLELLSLLTKCHLPRVVTHDERVDTLVRGGEGSIERRGSQEVRPELHTLGGVDVLRNLNADPRLTTHPEQPCAPDTKLIIEDGCHVLKQPLLILMPG